MPRLRAAALRFMGNDASAADVVQDVLMRLWELRGELRLPFDALAITLVRNVSVSALRHRRYTVGLEGHDSVDSSDDDTRVELLMELVDRLKPMQQLVVRLRHISGEEMPEIARLTGMKEPAVRKCLSRARMELRRLMLEEMRKQ